jgi:hypothetical protein
MSRFTRVLLLVQALLLLVAGGVMSHRSSSTPTTRLEAASTQVMPAVIAPAPKPKPKPKPKPVAKPVVKPVAKPKVIAKPKPVVKPKPKPRVIAKPRTVASPTPVKAVVSSGSAQQRMMDAVARIPGYRAGSAHWYLVAVDGYWGTADWYHDAIYISPSVPANRIYDVVAHEWAHLLSVKVYGNVNVATAAMNAFFGGSGVQGSEKAADCMARQLGASWTHYTQCTDARWLAGGADLLAGRKV